MCASSNGVSGIDHLLVATSPLPAMKKQVTFAENQKVNSEDPYSIFPRLTGIADSNSVLLNVSAVNSDSGLGVRRPLARHSPQHGPIIHIPRAMTSAPFLKNTELTPAQKEYLYTIAESYSAQHVRNLITQHYMNVLHRCIRTGNSLEQDSFVVTPEPEVQCALDNKSEKEASSSTKQQTHSGATHVGKSKLPKIQAKSRGRSPGTPTSKHRKTKKPTAKAPGLKKKTRLKRSRSSSLWDDLDLDIEEGPDDSLSECLSLMSIGVDGDSVSSDV